MFRDALSDVEDNDIDALRAEDASGDAEAMRQRLMAIDAERALLRQRLGLQGGEATKEATFSGLDEVFNRLSRELTPLLPQLAWELSALILAGVLTYFATKWAATSQKRVSCSRSHVREKALSSRFSASGYRRCFDSTPRAGLYSRYESRVAIHPSTSAQLPPKRVVESAGNWEMGLATSEQLEPALIKPPPGLALESADESTAVPHSGPGDCLRDVTTTEPSPGLVMDPGPPPGLECEETPADMQEVLSSSALPAGPPPGLECVETSMIGSGIADTQEILIPSAAHEETPEPLDAATQEPEKGKLQAPKRNKLAKVAADTNPSSSCLSDSEFEADPAVPEKCEVPLGAPTKSTVNYAIYFSAMHSAIVGLCRNFSWKNVPSTGDEPDHVVKKTGKRKGKQLQRAVAQKRDPEPTCKKIRASWGLRWPCSLPVTAALMVMLCIVLAGKTFQPTDSTLEAKEKELAEKKLHLEELKLKKAGYTLRLAKLQLQEFQEEAESVIVSLPAERAASLKGAKADAGQLLEALQDISNSEFPQVEVSYNNVYTGWKQILANAKRFADAGSCTEPDKGV